MIIAAPRVNGTLNFVESAAAETRAWVVTEAHNEMGVSFFRGTGQLGEKGVKNQNENDVCHKQRPTLRRPLMRPVPKSACKGTSALQMGSALALFRSGRAGRSMVPIHTPSVILPPVKCPTTPPFANMGLRERPQS